MDSFAPVINSNTVVVLHNPKSGARHAVELIEGLLAELRSRGWEVESFSDLDVFQQRTAQLHSLGRLRAVVAAGGDGTAAAVATRVDHEVPLRIFPLGTENLLAKHYRCNSDPIATADAIKKMETHQIDAATANGKIFLIMAGVGFDAEVVRRLHTNRKGHIRRWHYWWHIVASVFYYRFPQLRLIQNDAPKQPVSSHDAKHMPHNDVAWLFIQNLPRYADNLVIAKNAVDTDGFLNVSSFRRGGLVAGLGYLYSLRRERHTKLEDFQTRLLSNFRIEQVAREGDLSHTENASFQIDGDWGGYLPVEIRVLPRRVKIIL
jgi:diacylglycerol kinase family enzyme